MAQVHDKTAAFRINARLLHQLEERAQHRAMSFAELMRSAARRELEDAGR